MITVVISEAHERRALALLCQSRNWDTYAFDSLGSFRRNLTTAPPRVAIVRNRLRDGYSDDLIARLRQSHPARTRIIVLAAASISSTAEARQITLGADCVLRDPVRSEVLLAYLTRYVDTADSRSGSVLSRNTGATFPFANGDIDPASRELTHGKRAVRLTPREVSLARLLASSAGRVVDYGTLYEEVLGRAFEGETSNMRVLLGKLVGSTARVGVSLRPWIEVIAKSGYRYSAPGAK